MSLYLGRKEYWLAALLSVLLVVFVLYLHFIPSLAVFLLILLVCIVNFWINLSNLFVFLSLILAVIAVAPNATLTISRVIIPAKFISLTSTGLLVGMMGFAGGRCFITRRVISKSGSYALVVACIVAGILLRDRLLYERRLLIMGLILLCFGIINVSASQRAIFFRSLPRLLGVAFTIILIAVFLAANYLTSKAIPRVALIECFSEWGEMRTPYSQSNLTIESGYSYSLMKEVLMDRYRVVSVSDRRRIVEALKNADVALMITPTKPIDSASKKALGQFVSRGGRLVVIADHTDLYGHARVLNQALGTLGIFVEYDALFKPGDYYAEVRLVNMGMPSIRPKTPCSLKASWKAFVYGWADDWISEAADYTRPNFFGELSWTSDDLVGTWPVGAMIKTKRGMIVVWGDSTPFANFSIFQPGNLRLLGMLLEGGSILASFAPYCSILLIVLLVFLWSDRLRGTKMLFCLSCALAISSGGYYHWDFSPDKFYPLEKRLDVYCNPRLINEPPPGGMPLEGGISSIYSNIPRCGLWPYYKGKLPEKPLTTKSIWVTSFDQLSMINKQEFSALSGVIINGTFPDQNSIGVHPVHLEEEVAEPMKEFFPITAKRRTQYLFKGASHSFLYHGVPLFAAHGVLTDPYFGDWWTVTDVSPYRHFILKEFLNWLKGQRNVSKFSYPKPGIKPGAQEWEIKFEGLAPVRKKMVVVPYKNDPRFVYLGSGLWALYEKTAKGEFLVGGPETSDDWWKGRNVRWAARSVLRK